MQLDTNFLGATALCFFQVISASKSQAAWLPDSVKTALSGMTNGEKISAAAKIGDAVAGAGDTLKTQQSATSFLQQRMSGQTTFENGATQKAGESVATSGCGFYGHFCSLRDATARSAGALGELSNQQRRSEQAATSNASNYDRDQAWIAQVKETESARSGIVRQAQEKLPDRSVDTIAGSVPGGSLLQAAYESISEWKPVFQNGKQGAFWDMTDLAPKSSGEIKKVDPVSSRIVDTPASDSSFTKYEPSESAVYESQPLGGTDQRSQQQPRQNAKNDRVLEGPVNNGLGEAIFTGIVTGVISGALQGGFNGRGPDVSTSNPRSRAGSGKRACPNQHTQKDCMSWIADPNNMNWLYSK